MPTKIYVDADALPRKNKDIILKAVLRHRIPLFVVANQWIELPKRPFIKMKVVAQGFDKADEWIAERCTNGDLVITSDIPLANDCIAKNASVVTARGRVLNGSNIGPALSARNFSEDMRNSGLIQGGGPPPMGPREIQQFSNAFNQWVQQRS